MNNIKVQPLIEEDALRQDAQKTIVRAAHDKENPYTQISNNIFQDSRLSDTARLLIIYLLSLPDNWNINVQEVSTHFTCGYKRIQKSFKELVDFGYLEMHQGRNKFNKFLPFRYVVHEDWSRRSNFRKVENDPAGNLPTPPSSVDFSRRVENDPAEKSRKVDFGCPQNDQLLNNQYNQIINLINNECMYACEKTSVHNFDNEQTTEEQEMINSDNPLYEDLIERGLNKKQADEILAIEKTKVGYIQSNSSYFDNQFKNSPEKNNIGMLLTCLRNNWSKFGETAAAPKTTPKPIPTSYVPSSPVSVIDTPLTRREASNQRFERARAATPEQRIAWMRFAERIDCYCVPQFENLGLSKNDFVDFNLPGESPLDGKPTLFKSCVTRIMEVIEQSEKRDRDSRQSKFQKNIF